MVVLVKKQQGEQIMKRIAINGFGRIGRLAFRQLFNQKGIEIVAINNIAVEPKMLAHLLKYDSMQGRFEYANKTSIDGDNLVIDGKKIRILGEMDAAKLPWAELKIDAVLECTGVFTSYDKCKLHIDAGAKKVILSAPAKDAMPTVVFGVNHDILKASDNIISAASCTTNCLAPMAKALDDLAGIKSGFMTTIHAYTGDQNVLDGPHRNGDMRRARAAAVNIVPNSTGAAKAIGLVVPSLAGKLDGAAQRVPVATGSITELNVVVDKKVTADEVNKFMKGRQSDSFEYSDEELVSSDVIGTTAGSIFDATQTRVLPLENGGSLVKVAAWYDNEMGYVCQMARVLKYVLELK